MSQIRGPLYYFWKNQIRLAKLISAIWRMTSDREKNALLSRVHRGPVSSEVIGGLTAIEVEMFYITPFLLLLEKSGCQLDDDSQVIINRSRSNENWDVGFEEEAFNQHQQLRSYSVSQDTKYDALLKAPLAEVVPLAIKTTKRDFSSRKQFEPFVGLVANRPSRAYRALVIAAQRSELYPVELWSNLLNAQSETNASRLHLALAERLILMPVSTFYDLRYPVSNWLSHFLPSIAKNNLGYALSVWEKIFRKLMLAATEPEMPSKATSMALRGSVINAPLGKMLRVLFSIIPADKLAIPEKEGNELLQRLNMMMAASLESKTIVINICVSHLTWFFENFPSWTRRNLLPALHVESEFAQAAWNGFGYLKGTMQKRLFASVKKDFVQVFGQLLAWGWAKDLSRNLHEHLVFYCQSGIREGGFLSLSETRAVLQRTDDNGRANVLMRIAKTDDWKKFRKIFFQKAWPLELKFRNSRVTAGLIKVAISSKADFPDAVTTVVRLMTPLVHGDLTFYSDKGELFDLASSYPHEMLALLDAAVGESTVRSPYNLEAIVQAVLASLPALESDARMKRLLDHINQNPF